MKKVYFKADESSIQVLKACSDFLEHGDSLNLKYYGYPYDAYCVTFNENVQPDYFDDVKEHVAYNLQNFHINTEIEIIQL